MVPAPTAPAPTAPATAAPPALEGPPPLALEELAGALSALARGAVAGEARATLTGRVDAALARDFGGAIELRLEGTTIARADDSPVVFVPGGAFTLGSMQGEADERPAVEVVLRPFFVHRTEVTNAQYARFLRAAPEAGGHGPHCLPGEPPGKDHTPGAARAGGPAPGWKGVAPPAGSEQLPVTEIDWWDAMAYATWAGGVLPSEAQWEMVASFDPATRRKRTYPWGELWDGAVAVSSERGKAAAPAASLPEGASPFGALHMAGNVREWCLDPYRQDAYVQARGRTDPVAGADDLGRRVLRGGDFLSQRDRLRTGYRNYAGAGTRLPSIGFRVAFVAASAGQVALQKPDDGASLRLGKAPAPVFTWAREGASGSSAAPVEYTLTIATEPSFASGSIAHTATVTGALRYQMPRGEAWLRSGKEGTTYYWKVEGRLGGGDGAAHHAPCAAVRRFRVEPRDSVAIQLRIPESPDGKGLTRVAIDGLEPQTESFAFDLELGERRAVSIESKLGGQPLVVAGTIQVEAVNEATKYGAVIVDNLRLQTVELSGRTENGLDLVMRGGLGRYQYRLGGDVVVQLLLGNRPRPADTLAARFEVPRAPGGGAVEVRIEGDAQAPRTSAFELELEPGATRRVSIAWRAGDGQPIEVAGLLEALDAPNEARRYVVVAIDNVTTETLAEVVRSRGVAELAYQLGGEVVARMRLGVVE